MRFARLLQSSTFRLAVLYMALFGASVAVLLTFIYWSTAGYMALQTDDTVLVANDDRELEIRTVEVLRAEPRTVYIASGLEDGELVVTTSIDAPIPGTRLSIAGETPAVITDAEGAIADGGAVQ